MYYLKISNKIKNRKNRLKNILNCDKIYLSNKNLWIEKDTISKSKEVDGASHPHLITIRGQNYERSLHRAFS